MMRRLLLFRHASAGSATGGGDHARSLDPPGRAAARAMGARLAALDLRPDRVLCSSALRATETWEESRQAWISPPPVELIDALYLADPGTLMDVVGARGDEARTLMLIGHNPGLHQLAAGLAARGEEAFVSRLDGGFPAGAVAVVEFDADNWRDVDGDGDLTHFLVPEG